MSVSREHGLLLKGTDEAGRIINQSINMKCPVLSSFDALKTRFVYAEYTG